MKNFEDLLNAVGTFPNVTSVDCTGPGETDGTEWTSDTITDLFGWMQALLVEVGDTPNDAAEEDTASQLLNAIKMLPSVYAIPLTHSLLGVDWAFPTGVGNPWSVSSLVNSGRFNHGIILPDVPIDLTIAVRINPGAARTGTNRPNATLYYTTFASSTPQIEIGPAYTDTGSSLQTITLQKNFTPVANNNYILRVQAGNDGAANPDIVTNITVTKIAQ